MARNAWTDAEVAILTRKWPILSAKELARSWLPGRTYRAIWDKADHLNLKKTHYFRPTFPTLAEEIAAARAERATSPPFKARSAWEDLAP